MIIQSKQVWVADQFFPFQLEIEDEKSQTCILMEQKK